MEAQETELCCKNHQQELSDKIIDFFNNEAFVNVTLICNNERIKAHQIILAAYSPFFKNILTAEPNPNPVIILTDIAVDEMKLLLEYIYKGRVSVPKSIIPSLLEVAKKLQINVEYHEEVTNVQNTLEEDVAHDNTTPDLSPVQMGPSVQNFEVETGQKSNSVTVEPKKTTVNMPQWLTAAHNSKKHNEHSKKVINPFAKSVHSFNEKDTALYESNPWPLATTIKSDVEALSPTSVNNESDVEFIDINPSIIDITNTQVDNDNAEIYRKTNKRNHPTTHAKSRFDEAEYTSDESPLSAERLKKMKKDHSGVGGSNVEHLNRSKESNRSNTGKSENSKDTGDTNRRGKETSNVPQQSTANSRMVASTSKAAGIVKKTSEPFEGFSRKSCYELRRFCVVCGKYKKRIHEHIMKFHNVPFRSKNSVTCKNCLRRFNSKLFLKLHKCNSISKKK